MRMSAPSEISTVKGDRVETNLLKHALVKITYYNICESITTGATPSIITVLLYILSLAPN